MKKILMLAVVASFITAPVMAAEAPFVKEHTGQVSACQVSSSTIIASLNSNIDGDETITEAERGMAQDYVIAHQAEVGRWYRNACSYGAGLKKQDVKGELNRMIGNAKKHKTTESYVLSSIEIYATATGAALMGNLPEKW